MPTRLIEAEHIRYIKLGDGGRWAGEAFEKGEVQFGYHSVPHELCVQQDWEAVKAVLAESRSSAGAVTAGVTEVQAFYGLGANCLWITFADGHLWWTFADPAVTWHEHREDDGPSRSRRAVGWRKTDVHGKPLRVDALSSKLTQVAGFRATICRIKEADYLLRRINGSDEPIVERAKAARSAMIEIAAEMIRGLHWADFETLSDLIFARSGWQRSTRVGENLADIDIIMEQPTTGETAFVQVKSKASQSVVNDYLGRFRRSGCNRFFFICHSELGSLSLPPDRHLHLWVGQRLAEATVKNGLYDWLIDRSG